jgi:hypothetical protein
MGPAVLGPGPMDRIEMDQMIDPWINGLDPFLVLNKGVDQIRLDP